MMDQTYGCELIFGRPKTYGFCIRAWGTHGLLIWRRVLMETYEHEFSLNSGRFLYFSKIPLPYVVMLDGDEYLSLNRGDMLPRYQDMIEWCADHTELWNISVENMIDYRLCFSFEREKDAVLFKLVFG